LLNSATDLAPMSIAYDQRYSAAAVASAVPPAVIVRGAARPDPLDAYNPDAYNTVNPERAAAASPARHGGG
jgi:hypothetical protein